MPTFCVFVIRLTDLVGKSFIRQTDIGQTVVLEMILGELPLDELTFSNFLFYSFIKIRQLKTIISILMFHALSFLKKIACRGATTFSLSLYKIPLSSVIL